MTKCETDTCSHPNVYTDIKEGQQITYCVMLTKQQLSRQMNSLTNSRCMKHFLYHSIHTHHYLS